MLQVERFCWTKLNFASTLLPFLATMSSEISSFRQSQKSKQIEHVQFGTKFHEKLHSTSLPKNDNNVEATFDFVKATFNFVERIVRLVAFDNIASTLLLVWTGLDKKTA